MSKRDPKGFYPIPELGDGVKFQSVTHIQDVLRKFQVEQWKVDCGVEYLFDNSIGPYLAGDMTLDQFREIRFDALVEDAKKYYTELQGEGKDFGTRFHEAMNNYHTTGAWPIDPELREAFKNTIEWEEAVKLDVLASEKFVYSKTFQYAGTLDIHAQAIFTPEVGQLSGVLDYKTFNGKKGKRPTIYPTQKQQVAAYIMAYEEMTGDLLDFGGIITVNKTTSEVIPHIYFRNELVQPSLEFIALANYANVCIRGKKK
jgi:hypothetical protein